MTGRYLPSSTSFDEEQVLLAIAADAEPRALAADEPRNEHEERHVVHEPEVCRDVGPAGIQRPATAAERKLADRVEDHVIRLTAAREVLAKTIVDLPRAERLHELDVLPVAHRRDVRPDVVHEELDERGSDRARGAVDEDALLL